MRKLLAGLSFFTIFLCWQIIYLSSKENDSISLAFVGDVMLAGRVGRQILKEGTDYPFAKVKSILSLADIAFCNLEGALTNKRLRGRLIFCFPTYFVQSLIEGGIDIVSLANNHANDGTLQGIIETIETLERAKIKYVGAGRNYDEARSLRIIEVKNKKIGFLAYTDLSNIGLHRAVAMKNRPGVASAKSKSVFNEIQTAKRKVDLLVVSFHWGIEGQMGEPNKRQKDLAYSCIKEGADIVVGHHPHVLQKVEIYRGKTIAYSLGNFVFSNRRPATSKTMILWIDWNPNTKKQEIRKITCYIGYCRPETVNKL